MVCAVAAEHLFSPFAHLCSPRLYACPLFTCTQGDKLRIGPVYLVFTLPIPEKTKANTDKAVPSKNAAKPEPPLHPNDKGTPSSSTNGRAHGAALVGAPASSSGTSSKTSSGRPATGGGGSGSGLGKYALMIHAAFTAARQEGACASDGSLSKQDVVDRYLQTGVAL